MLEIGCACFACVGYQDEQGRGCRFWLGFCSMARMPLLHEPSDRRQVASQLNHVAGGCWRRELFTARGLGAADEIFAVYLAGCGEESDGYER